MTRDVLVMIPVPPEEARQRMVRARQEAKAATKEAGGIAQFGPKSARMSAKIEKLNAEAHLNDRIAIGCKIALDNMHANADDFADEPLPVPADVDEEGG